MSKSSMYHKAGERLLGHLKRHGHIYLRTGAVLTTLVITQSTEAQALMEGGGIDAGGMAIYKQIVKVGKWIIVIKGAITIIQEVSAGDFESAKTTFMKHLIIFASLLALPWGMDMIEQTFSDM